MPKAWIRFPENTQSREMHEAAELNLKKSTLWLSSYLQHHGTSDLACERKRSQNETYISDVFDLILGQFAQMLILALYHQLQSGQPNPSIQQQRANVPNALE